MKYEKPMIEEEIIEIESIMNQSPMEEFEDDDYKE